MNRIKEVLKIKGLTQKDLAVKLGVTEPVVSIAINGNPTLKTLHEIASVLGVRASELIDEQPIDIFNCPYCGKKIKIEKEDRYV
jgi:transcriptional regulator with XRE-family HTH domain